MKEASDYTACCNPTLAQCKRTAEPCEKCGSGKGEKEKVCPNCYWYRQDKSYVQEILCSNLGRENWKGIEESNSCNDFVFPCDYKPDPAWVMLVDAVNGAIKNKP